MSRHWRPDSIPGLTAAERRRLFGPRPSRWGRTTIAGLLGGAFVVGAAAGLAPRLAAGGAARPTLAAGEAAGGIRADFAFCHWGGGRNCVVDGDTFYIGGDKVRIAGIDAPETHPPRCAEEARLGAAATERLQALLNSGAVTMTAIDRDRDAYGRLLRDVAVDGADVGEALIAEGVARDFGSGRRSWCG